MTEISTSFPIWSVPYTHRMSLTLVEYRLTVIPLPLESRCWIPSLKVVVGHTRSSLDRSEAFSCVEKVLEMTSDHSGRILKPGCFDIQGNKRHIKQSRRYLLPMFTNV